MITKETLLRVAEGSLLLLHLVIEGQSLCHGRTNQPVGNCLVQMMVSLS